MFTGGDEKGDKKGRNEELVEKIFLLGLTVDEREEEETETGDDGRGVGYGDDGGGCWAKVVAMLLMSIALWHDGVGLSDSERRRRGVAR